MNTVLTIYNDKTLPIGSLEAYISWANQIPMLSATEEKDLAVRFREQGDLQAARKLVLSNLRFVVRIARGYTGYGLQQADLIQEGNIGLMKAAKRFDPSVGVRLISFAVHWIKAEIHEFVLRNWRIVKVATTKAQRKLFFNLRKMTKRLGFVSEEEVQHVAKELKVSAKEVRRMEQRLYNFDVAFDGFNNNSEEAWKDPANYLEAKGTDPSLILENSDWKETKKQQLQHAFAVLDARSKDILTQRRLNEQKVTLHELAKKYNISAERVRQLEEQALAKLKSKLSKSSKI